MERIQTPDQCQHPGCKSPRDRPPAVTAAATARTRRRAGWRTNASAGIGNAANNSFAVITSRFLSGQTMKKAST